MEIPIKYPRFKCKKRKSLFYAFTKNYVYTVELHYTEELTGKKDHVRILKTVSPHRNEPDVQRFILDYAKGALGINFDNSFGTAIMVEIPYFDSSGNDVDLVNLNRLHTMYMTDKDARVYKINL